MKELSSVHFVGIGGVGTGSLATALSSAGIKVTGSDKALYEPMKGVLERAHIELVTGHEASHVQRFKPDLVIIGNVITKENPEAQAWIRSGVPFVSFPEAVRRFVIKDRHSIVVAGTHGKTTTTSWVTFLLEHAGQNPSYLIGGVPFNMSEGSRITDSSFFVGEGDEYDSAFFDKGPKFLHYKPDFLILNSIEFDHADIYRDLDHVRSSFEKLVALLPGDGLCISRYEEPVVMDLMSDVLCPVQTFGLDKAAMWHVDRVQEGDRGFEFDIIYKTRNLGPFRTPLLGAFNLMNIVAGVACGVNLGIPIETIREAVSEFRGVKRRQEIRMEDPIVLIDDFAHHPTEVRNTLSAVRGRFKNRRLWAIFEPRSATARRNTHQKEYAQAFDSADHILISEPFAAAQLDESKRMNSSSLVEAISQAGKSAQSVKSSEEILAYFRKTYQKGDVVVVMSNGEFDKIVEKIQSEVR